ncbi:MAG: hypothetical protein JRN39_02210 [Nitrososphaerota archaeon]|nr:hypothetical protein [Nitrososphaerota archaeon]
MKASIIWHTPEPEKTIATAMRRCYSTKPLQEIQAELDEKGEDYWRHLIGLALRDKSFDVIEHFCLEVLLEGLKEGEVGNITMVYPFAHFLSLGGDSWLLSVNARTLLEMWHSSEHKHLVHTITDAMKEKGIGAIYSSVAFGGS